jgi:uncharacterized protein (DUF2141 family)
MKTRAMVLAAALALLTASQALPARAAEGVAVTPEMRRAMQGSIEQDCLKKEAEFARQGYSKAQVAAICRCAAQQTSALLNSQTVSHILSHGAMPEDMQRKVASATGGCIKSSRQLKQ